jgi:hypothetical protein
MYTNKGRFCTNVHAIIKHPHSSAIYIMFPKKTTSWFPQNKNIVKDTIFFFLEKLTHLLIKSIVATKHKNNKITNRSSENLAMSTRVLTEDCANVLAFYYRSQAKLITVELILVDKYKFIVLRPQNTNVSEQ